MDDTVGALARRVRVPDVTLEEYVRHLLALRREVAELWARLFSEGVEGAPVNMQPLQVPENPFLPRLLKKVQMQGGARGAGYPPKVDRRRTAAVRRSAAPA